MTATMFIGGSALDSDLHMYLGMTTSALYFTTAYYSLAAPKPVSIKDKARMKWHKGLAWVHFPLMIITPILGYLYKKHEEDGKKHSSFEKQHSAFAGALYGSFTLSAAVEVTALVCMSGMFSGATRAVLTSTVFAIEATGAHFGIAPLLLGKAAAYLWSILLMKETIMTEKISRRGVQVPHEYFAK